MYINYITALSMTKARREGESADSLDNAMGSREHPGRVDERAAAVLAQALPAVRVGLLERHLPRPLPRQHTASSDDPHVVAVCVRRLPADWWRREGDR